MNEMVKVIMKNILLVATGSVAIEKFKKIYDLLGLSFNIKVITTQFVMENFDQWKDILIEQENTKLNTFPSHIKHALWADLIIVVPATANTLSKFNAGIADNQALSTLMAARQPIIFIPAMNTLMYDSLIKRGIIENLKKLGHMFIGPIYGQLREGIKALGRMVEPEEINSIIKNFFNKNKKEVLIVYGASKVYIDPIRYITNGSSGTMARLIESELKIRGHNVQMINVGEFSNEELIKEIKKRNFEYYITPAALADYDLAYFNNKKIRKNTIKSIELINNKDVLEEVSKMNKKIIAFKLDDDQEKAINKFEKYKLFAIIWNKLDSIGMGSITGSIITKEKKENFYQCKKNVIAKKIGDLI